MRPLVLALPLAVLAFVALPVRQAAAQTTNSRGTLTAMTTDSITVKVGTTDMKFTIDPKTTVEAPGGGTKERQAQAAGKPGAKLSDVLKVGDAVEVSHTAANHATMIRKVSSPGSGGVPAKTATGTVTAISATSMSIEGSSGGGGAKFTQTFSIDSKTHVVARGASTTLAGGAPITNAVGKGDRVSVEFDEAAGSPHATEVRVTMKAAK
jgi:Domain of unknown function (DUF5666)